MEVSAGGVGLKQAIEKNREEDAEEARKELYAELAAGLSAAAASLMAAEQVMPGAGVVMQGLAAIPMPGVMRPVDFEPEANTKLLAKVAVYQDQQQAQFFAQKHEEKQRDAQADLTNYEEELVTQAQKAAAKEASEQPEDEAASDQYHFLDTFLNFAAQRLQQVGTLRINEGEGGSTLWKTRQDEGGESVLQQVLTTSKAQG